MNQNFMDLMSEAKFFEGYSRFNDDLNRYETWEEAIERVMNMHRFYYADFMSESLKEYINLAENVYKQKEVLGAQRALQFGGDQILNNHARLYNCSGSYADRPEFFGECFHLMLCGCGVGFSVQFPHIETIPSIRKRDKDPKTFVVPDSIEGWARALDVLMSSFFKGGGVHQEYEGHKVYFDLDQIRPKGAYISGGFKAPGPEPLRKALDKIEQLIKDLLKSGENKLRSIHIYDITMHAADAVISGGVRRAATICLFSLNDLEMMKAKTGNWLDDNPQRARSNNSAVLLRNETSYAELQSIVSYIKEYGEPGFVFSDDIDVVFNPCVPGDTLVNTTEGVKEVYDLVGKNCNVLVNGVPYNTNGFVKTGTKPIYTISTKEGHYVKATANHKFLLADGTWKELRDLKSGDILKIHDHSSNTFETNINEEEKGWLLGSFVGDGIFNNNKAILKYDTYLKDIAKTYLSKHFSDFIAKTNTAIISSRSLADFARKFRIYASPNIELDKASIGLKIGYIRGLFDVSSSVQNNGISIRLYLLYLQQVQRILNSLGINSIIKSLSNSYELVIIKNNIQKYLDIIGFNAVNKLEKLKTLLNEDLYKDKFEVTITKIDRFGVEDVYDIGVPEVHCFDANGFVAHNCCEIGLYPKLEDGSTGFQQCNLTEINGAKAKSKEVFFKQCQAAAILGTLQAGYTDFKFLNEESHRLIEEEALIGVGITGWMNNPDLLFDKDIMKEGAEIVKTTNKVVAELIGINPAARCTTVKPAGNSSVLLGCTSGIHGEHSPLYLRNVQFNKETEIAKIFERINPDMVSESVWSQNNTDYCVSFPVISPKGSKYKSELLGIKQLEYVKKAQQYWIEYGTDVELCRKPYLRHNVSNTITVDDWDEVIDYIYDNRDYFCGVSFMSEFGDKALPQVPFTEVLNLEELTRKYGAEVLLTSALIEAGLHAFNDDLWIACNTALGKGKDISKKIHSNVPKREFVRRFNKFAENFSSKEKCAECLLNVHLFHKWWKIQKTCRYINFANELEEKQFTDINIMGAQACAGGACDIV